MELIARRIMIEACAFDEDRDDPEVGVIVQGELTTAEGSCLLNLEASPECPRNAIGSEHKICFSARKPFWQSPENAHLRCSPKVGGSPPPKEADDAEIQNAISQPSSPRRG